MCVRVCVHACVCFGQFLHVYYKMCGGMSLLVYLHVCQARIEGGSSGLL